MERVRKMKWVIGQEWSYPAGNSSEQMDLPLYNYLIVFLIKGTQSNSETCVQAGKEKNLAVNINLASLQPAPLKNSNYRRGKKAIIIQMCSRKSKKVSKIAFFMCHQWGRSSGQEQVISMGMAIHTQPDLPLGLGFGLVSVPTVQADVYVVGGKLHLVTDLAFFSLKKKKNPYFSLSPSNYDQSDNSSNELAIWQVLSALFHCALRFTAGMELIY